MMDALLAFEEEWLADEREAPSGIDAALGLGMDERRLHLRAYDRWMAARQQGACPTLPDFLAEGADEFAPYSLLLRFDAEGKPTPSHVGHRLRGIVGNGQGAALLSRLAAYHPVIVTDAMPVGFEAELAGGLGRSLHRGILLPIADDAGHISSIYAVISAKALAGNQETISLALEVDRALAEAPGFAAEHLWSGPASNNCREPAAHAFALA
jgi:hypothetical protein